MKKLLALLSIASMFAIAGCDDDNDNSSKTTDPVTPITTSCTANACVAGTTILKECVGGQYVPKDCGAAGCNAATNTCNTSSNPTQTQCTVSVCNGNILNECVGGQYVPKNCGSAGCNAATNTCNTSGGNDDPQTGGDDDGDEVETTTPCNYDQFVEKCVGNKYQYCDYSEEDEDKDVVWEGTCPSTHTCATTTVTGSDGSYVYASCVSNTAGEESDFCDSEGANLYLCDVDDEYFMYLAQYTYTCMKWSDNKLHYFPLYTDYSECTTCSETANGCVLETCDASAANASSCSGLTGKSCEEIDDGKAYLFSIDCSFYNEILGSSACVLDEGFAYCDMAE